MRIDCGTPHDPWSAGRVSTEDPEIDPTALVRASDFGRFTYLGPRSIVADSVFGDYAYACGDNQIAHAEIGKFANLATGVRINPPNHPWWRPTLHHFTYRSVSYGLAEEDDAEIFDWRRRDRVQIGPDTWFGHNAIVMPGVSIGAGAVVGSGAVVTKDVPPFAIVVGVPAWVLRFRCDAKVAEAIMAIGWWDWDHARIRAALPDFRSLDLRAFVEKYG